MTNFTKQALANTLKKLLNERPISRITIRDLTEETHVNRQTFYYHFQDIYELGFWTLEQDLSAFVAQAKVERNDIYANTHLLFRYFQENRRMIRNAYDSVNRIQYESLFREYAYPYILDNLRSREASQYVAEEDLSFIATFYTQALSGFLIRWIEIGMPDENRIPLDKLCKLMDGSVDTNLEKFKQS